MIDHERVLRQEELNKIMSDLGDSKFVKNAERMAKVGGFGNTKGGERAADQALEGFVMKLDEYMVNNTSGKTGRKPTLVNKTIKKYSSDDIVYRVNPSTIARITIKAVMSSLVRPEDKRINITTVASMIGDSLEYAVKTIILDSEFAKEKHKMMEMLKRQERLDDLDEVRKVMNNLAADLNIDHEPWTNHEQLEVGYAALQLLQQSTAWIKKEGFGDEKQETTFGRFFLECEESTFDYAAKHLKSKKTFKISSEGLQWLAENEEFMKGLTFGFLPMVTPPMDWVLSEDGKRIVGGFDSPTINSRYTLIKGLSNKELVKLYEGSPQGFETLMQALNLAQAVPFKINHTVFNAVKWVNDNKISLDRKGIPSYRSAWVEFLGSEEKAQEWHEVNSQKARGEDGKLTKEYWEIKDRFIISVIPGAAAMTTEQFRKEWFVLHDAVIKFGRAENSKKILIDNILVEADRFLNDEIYFCYNADFRSRIYPISGLFSPQGSDTSRGMLEFANVVKAEGEHTIDNIAFQIANSYGEDKVSVDARIDWVWKHTLDILASADNFIENQFWMKADKPFLFLLGCIEWAKVIKAVTDAELDPSKSRYDFETSLPIAYDGSCNGIQHFSAILRDEEGAEHVNLIPQELPADVYQVVATAALHIAQTDPKEPKWKRFIADLDKALEGKLFDRKSAKRAVMTTPYGVSRDSAGKYILEEVDKTLRNQVMLPKERKETRKLMKKLIWDAILDNVGAPVKAKEYFQKVAIAMAKSSCSIDNIDNQEACELEGGEWTGGIGLKWFTPTGLPILQSYKAQHPKYKRIKVTVNGKSIDRKYPKYTSELDLKEQANGIAPNFVHSFDSSHLQKTAIAANKEGMDKFLFIHDSFATDANNATRFNHIIREQFVDMYLNKDYIKEFHDRCERQLGRPLIDEDGVAISPLKLGSFDVRRVLYSIYFFA